MKKSLLLLLAIFFAFGAFAQDDDYDTELPDTQDEEFVGFNKKKKDKNRTKRWRLGGDFGFSATEFLINTEISPLLGYQIIEDRLEVGGGIVYQYTNIRRTFISLPSGNTFVPAKINVLGGRNYARAYVWEGLYLQLEGILINYRERPKDVDRLIKLTIGNALAGVGYKLDIADNIHTNFSVSTNLIINPLYPQRTLIPRIGFQISL